MPFTLPRFPARPKNKDGTVALNLDGAKRSWDQLGTTLSRTIPDLLTRLASDIDTVNKGK